MLCPSSSSVTLCFILYSPWQWHFSPSVLLLYPNKGQVPKDHLSVMQSCWSPKVPFPDLWSFCFPLSTSWSPKAGTHDRQRKCYIQVHPGEQVPFFVLFVWLLVYIQEHELEFAYWRLGDSKTVAWPKSSTQAQPSRRCINRAPTPSAHTLPYSSASGDCCSWEGFMEDLCDRTIVSERYSPAESAL